MSEQTAQPQRTPLTTPQALVLCALLSTMTLAMAWFGAHIYYASQPPIRWQARDGSLIGRSIGTIEYWEQAPDPVPKAPGWKHTFSSSDTFDGETIVGVNTDADGRVIECRVFVSDPFVGSCFGSSREPILPFR